MSHNDPTPQEPEAYLALRKFSQRIKCRRTGSPVSFADLGDEDGVPLLWMMPSGGSRWFAAAHDPLCRRYGVRMIVVDRPGIGATPSVPLENRVEVACQQVCSVLEHLKVKPAHLLAASAGIYYALHLLTNHSDIFAGGLQHPANVYLVSPWSPLLPPDHPDFYPSYFTWIPTSIISTQHYTLPGLMKAGQQAATLWTSGQKAWTTARSWMKGWTGNAAQATASSSKLEMEHEVRTKESLDAPPLPEGEEKAALEHEASAEEESQEDAESRPKPLWGPCACCISCLVTEYFHAENFEGVGQDHLLCLNRGTINTGPEWYQNTLLQLDARLLAAQDGRIMRRIPLQIWWGWQDGMVPRQGQLWLNKTLGVHDSSLDITIHDVEDGDHNDLLARRDGIYQVYDMVGLARERGDE